MIINCNYCNKQVEKSISHINRASKLNAKLFCSKECSSLNRRKNQTVEEKKKLKAEYDKKYREKNSEILKIKKHNYYVNTYNPELAALERKNKYSKHLEYLRQPKYKQYKKEYDVKYNAKKNYNEFWESFILIKKIENEYDQQEIRQVNNLHNKAQKRKRKWLQKN
jgi:hypothetical protein